MSSFFSFLIAILFIVVLFFVVDVFCRFLANKVVKKRLYKKVLKMNDDTLLKSYNNAKTFSGSVGYIIGFFFTGLFVFSFMRIPKAQLKVYGDELVKRNLNL
ncbi:hypothetical protein [Elizabethkingia anophelis]|uniref:hypothetical protein n=1 Tax=Elizabethkingia anophelis TaxID=1117645 RepID=UPI0032084687